jgi:hypothetical protein
VNTKPTDVFPERLDAGTDKFEQDGSIEDTPPSSVTDTGFDGNAERGTFSLKGGAELFVGRRVLSKVSVKRD